MAFAGVKARASEQKRSTAAPREAVLSLHVRCQLDRTECPLSFFLRPVLLAPMNGRNGGMGRHCSRWKRRAVVGSRAVPGIGHQAS